MPKTTTPLDQLRAICLALPEAHHGKGRPAVWCKAAPGEQDPTWEDVESLLRDGYRLVASPKLRVLLDEAEAK